MDVTAALDVLPAARCPPDDLMIAKQQKANTSDLIIGIADLIVFASAYYTLMPGDC